MKTSAAIIASILLTAALASCSGNGETQRSENRIKETTSTSRPSASPASTPKTECELNLPEKGTWQENEKAFQAWEACKKPRPPAPPFSLPAEDRRLAEQQGRHAVQEVRSNHTMSGITREDHKALGLTDAGMDSIDAGSIINLCFYDQGRGATASWVDAVRDSPSRQPKEWIDWENLDGSVYRGYSNEDGTSWSSQYEKHFMVVCAETAAQAARSWQNGISLLLASCAQQYEQIVSFTDVTLNNPHQLSEPCEP